MKTAIYIRVSTKLQENKYSLKAQKEELTKYAISQGWEIVGEFKDVDSGGKLDKVGLNALMDFVEEGNVDVVLCIDQDRLSRLDTISWEFLKSTLRENGVKIAEPGNITDLTNEDEEFISDIKNLIAKREKRAIVRRMMRGKRQRTREGKGWGKPPMEYHYDKNNGTYSINTKWSWIIPFIDDLYLNKGYSDQMIAHELNSIGPTPLGKKWTDVHVRKKLTNKAYHGIMEKSFSNGETITVEDIYPPLRSAKDFEKIQDVRKRKFRRRKEEYPQLLRRTKLSCAKCGKTLGIHMSGDPNYSIHFYIKHQKKDTQHQCYVSINMLRVENNLITAIKAIITGEDMAKKYIQLDYDENDLAKLENDLKATNLLKNDVQGQIDRLLPLYLKGSWSEEELDKQKVLLENELKAHVNRMKQLQAKKELIRANMFNYDMVIQYLAVAERFEVLLTKDEQMELIGTLFPTGTVYDDQIILHGQLPNNVPLEVVIPVEQDPYEKSRRPKKIDSKGTYEKIHTMMKEHPGMSQAKIAEALAISPSTINRLRDRFGEFEGQVKAIQHDPEGKRHIILEYMKENPNASLRQIARETGIATTTIKRIQEKYNLL